MKKILITGGAGYLGSMISTGLVNKGYKVTVIDKLIYSKTSLLHLLSHKNFLFVEGDVTDEKIMKKYIKNQDIIIPLAALVGAPLCQKKPKIAVELNVNAIKYLCRISKSNQKIIYMTTNSGYGVGEKNKFCDENSTLRPISLYGKTKNEAEKIVKKRGNYVAFRLATVFGFSYRMRTDLLVNFMVLTALTKKKIEIFEPNFRRNFVHISDVSNAIIHTIQNFEKMKNNVYNLGLSNANITKINLLKKIKKHIPELKIIINRKKKDPDKRDYFVSNRKIEKKGFKAKFSLDDGIEELINVFKYIKNIKLKNNY